MKPFVEFVAWGPEDARVGALRAYDLWLQQPRKKGQKRFECYVCVHPRRRVLDEGLLSGLMTPLEVAREVGPNYSKDKVLRHRDRHLLPLLGMPLEHETSSVLTGPHPVGSAIQIKLGWYRTQFLALRQTLMIKREDGTYDVDKDYINPIIKCLVEARTCDVIAAKMPDGAGVRRALGLSAEEDADLQRLEDARRRRDEALGGALRSGDEIETAAVEIVAE